MCIDGLKGENVEIVYIDLRERIKDLITLVVGVFFKINSLIDVFKGKVDMQEPYIDAMIPFMRITTLPSFVLKMVRWLSRDRIKRIYIDGYSLSQ